MHLGIYPIEMKPPIHKHILKRIIIEGLFTAAKISSHV